jgi:hypothetical protein
MKVAIMDRLIGELTAIESALAALQQQVSLNTPALAALQQQVSLNTPALAAL